MKKIKLFEYDCILFFLMQGLTFGTIINLYAKKVEIDCYLIPIIGAIIGLIPLFIIIKLQNKNTNINDLNKSTFGKILGNIINVLTIIVVLIMGLIIFWNLISFIQINYLYKTPKIIISIAFSIPIVYILSKDITVICRTIVILFFAQILLFSLSLLGVINQIDPNEFFPVFQSETSKLILTSLFHISFVILPMFLITIFKKDQIKDNTNIKKHNIIVYLISNFITFIIIFCNLGTFGIELLKIYKYPEFEILKKVSALDFIQRIEAALSIYWIINLFIFITLSICYIKFSLKQIFKINSKKYNFIFSIFVFIFCICGNFIFKNNDIANNFTYKFYTPIAFIFFLFVPILIIIKNGKN